MSTTEHREQGAFVAALMPPAMKARLVSLAHQHERTVSAELRVAVKAHLERAEARRP